MEIELAPLPCTHEPGRREHELPSHNFNPAPDDHERGIPRADGGIHAWLFLAACFMVEALVWGFPFTFGLFQQYYSEHEPFASQGNVAVVGTCSMVCSSSLLFLSFCRRFGYSTRQC